MAAAVAAAYVETARIAIMVFVRLLVLSRFAHRYRFKAWEL